DIIFCNAPEDRHPDHGKAAKLVYDAFFLAGLSKVKTSLQGKTQYPWRPYFLFNYIQDRTLQPHFFIDISNYWDKKISAVCAYASQFHVPKVYASDEPATYISSASFLESWEARHRTWGKNIGTKYAEGFISVRSLGMKNLDFLIPTPY
ncbi:MAG: bacillithiol biosynthesis deacetylase BshB1, partial [Chitinophagaceae bacterium]